MEKILEAFLCVSNHSRELLELKSIQLTPFSPDSCLLLVKINSKRKKQVKDLLRSYSDAHYRSRTFTLLPEQRPERCASANSAKWAFFFSDSFPITLIILPEIFQKVKLFSQLFSIFFTEVPEK